MKFNRNIIVCILAVVCVAASDDSLLSQQPRRSLLFFPPFITVPKPSVNNKPFSIFSRPPLEKDEEHKGQDEGGFISHVGNILHGGSIGIEIRPLAPFQGILDHAKKFIPGRGTVGRPSHERPDYEQPNKDHPHYEDRPNNDHERPNYPNKEHNPYERPNTHQPPKKEEIHNEEEWETHKKDPQPGRPQWEDIGEVPSTGEEDYGEGVLQPRRRPKRFVESKIYHVPLLFRSNGRADRVRIKGRNGLREKSEEN